MVADEEIMARLKAGYGDDCPMRITSVDLEQCSTFTEAMRVGGMTWKIKVKFEDYGITMSFRAFGRGAVTFGTMHALGRKVRKMTDAWLAEIEKADAAGGAG